MSDGHTHEHSHDEDVAAGHASHTGPLARSIRLLRTGHTHSHAATIESALTASVEGIRALWISVGILAATALVEGGLVIVTGSVAVLGDSIHNAADVLTAVPLGVAFWLQRRPPNRRYTFGYGRAEDLAGVLVCTVIGASAGITLWISISRLLHPHHVTALWCIVAAGIVGFVGNEVVALYRIRVGRHIGSAALVADGLHARVDGITSLAVVVGAIGVACGWPDADAIVGIGISIVILNVFRIASICIVRRLMDSVDPALLDQIEAVLVAVGGVEGVTNVRVRWIGHRLEAEATVVSDGGITLAQSHEIAEEAHHRLLHEVPLLSYALIHSDPVMPDGTTPHGLTEHHFT